VPDNWLPRIALTVARGRTQTLERETISKRDALKLPFLKFAGGFELLARGLHRRRAAISDARDESPDYAPHLLCGTSTASPVLIQYTTNLVAGQCRDGIKPK